MIRQSPSEVLNKNMDGDVFPLFFARKICVATGQWDKLEEPDQMIRYYQNEMLKNFQQMSITCTFQASLIAYHGEELTEDHLDGLAIIHKATKAWLKGEVVGTLMRKINDKKIANKDFAASIAIIMENLEDEKSNNGINKTKTKELVVRLSNMEEISKLGKTDE